MYCIVRCDRIYFSGEIDKGLYAVVSQDNDGIWHEIGISKNYQRAKGHLEYCKRWCTDGVPITKIMD